MPNVGSYEFKGNDGSWKDPTYVQGHDGSSWKYGIAVYIHNGTSWVEVWNARPVAVSTSMATTSTGLTFSGTADPNNFSTTAKFQYKEVGGSYSDSGTTSTGMGDGVDSAVSYTVAATVADTYKNWEARASASNTAGTGVGSTLTLDCRKSGPTWGTSDSSNNSTCDDCGTVTTRTYTRSGCQTYSAVVTNCGTRTYYSSTGTYDGISYTVFTDWVFGTPYLRRTADGNGGCGCDSYYAWSVSYCDSTNSWRHTPLGCVQWVMSCG
jgi:hypothetical protein